MLGQSRRRWPSISPAMVQCLVLAGWRERLDAPRKDQTLAWWWFCIVDIHSRHNMLNLFCFSVGPTSSTRWTNVKTTLIQCLRSVGYVADADPTLQQHQAHVMVLDAHYIRISWSSLAYICEKRWPKTQFILFHLPHHNPTWLSLSDNDV